MRTRRIFFVLFVMSLYAAPSFSQDQRTLEFLRQEELRRHAEILRHLDSGVYFIDHAKYTEADKKFRYVLQNIKSVPSDLTFYFGKNSYFLNQYKQSIDWLN